MNILIVENNLLQQRALTLFFENLIHFKIKLFIKENGKKGLDFIKSNKEKIDLIFTDVKMPVMDGVEFCSELRKIDNLIPIVLMTANYEQYNSHTVPGVNKFIIKPFDFDLIGDIVYNYRKEQTIL